MKNPYQRVHRLLLTIYNNKQMRYELEKTSRYFPAIETLTVRLEQSVSSALFGLYMEKILDLNYVKHLTLYDKCHTVSTVYELVSRKFICCKRIKLRMKKILLGLSNLSKLTITSNHRILVKQIFQKRNEHLLFLLSQRILHLNLLYDGVITYDTVELIRYNFPRLKSFTACLPHFEDFRDTIPAFIRQMKSLEYLHIGLECDNDKKNFGTQDMYDWFRRHNISQEFQLHIDVYTNSIHIWL